MFSLYKIKVQKLFRQGIDKKALMKIKMKNQFLVGILQNNIVNKMHLLLVILEKIRDVQDHYNQKEK